jgi:thymidylate synthase (FAD)
MKVTVVQQSAKLLWTTPRALQTIEQAGRTCYKSEDKITRTSAEAFVRRIVASGHESVLEHASASFRLVTDRGITHELVRHRICSFSQESTRYVNYLNRGIAVVEPLWREENVLTRNAWVEGVHYAMEAYDFLINAGCPAQEARDVLPTCTKAEIVVTANFREWRHIIKLRTDKAAHPKIRQLIGMVRDKLATLYPVVFGETP